MRILYVSNYYPPHEVGGYEQLCRDVAVRLADRGHFYCVLTSNHGVAQSDTTQESGACRLLHIQPRSDVYLGIPVQFWLTRKRAEVHNRSVFHRIVQEFQPDVVFIWNLQGLPHELALDAEALPGVATAYWLAGYSPAEPDLFWRYWEQAPGQRTSLHGVKVKCGHLALARMRKEGKPVKPEMRHVAVVSEYMRRKGQVDGTLPANTQVIYNGVEFDLFFRPVPPPFTTPPINVLLAGRVAPDKGVHIAVEAIAKLARTRPQRDYRLLVAGNGPSQYLQQLRQLVSDHGIADLVSFLGWLPREQIPALMQMCHILALPTVHQEPFARVTLEAMAAGMAVVGTLTGGTGEILQDEFTGLVCASDDSDDMARQLNRLIGDHDLRYRLAVQGQKTVRSHYTIDLMVEALNSLLERAAKEQSSEYKYGEI